MFSCIATLSHMVVLDVLSDVCVSFCTFHYFIISSFNSIHLRVGFTLVRIAALAPRNMGIFALSLSFTLGGSGNI